MKKFYTLSALLILSAALFFSCVSGSALVTGTQRPPIEPSMVKVYPEPPAKYEIIGIVTATSEYGWSEQSDLNEALKELKNQAAKIGANGILIDSVSVPTTGFSSYDYYATSSKSLQGKAIYVSE